jgi:hypothetical protein
LQLHKVGSSLEGGQVFGSADETGPTLRLKLREVAEVTVTAPFRAWQLKELPCGTTNPQDEAETPFFAL